MRVDDALSYFEDNLRTTEAYAADSEGIARNHLAEALVVAGQYERAQTVLEPILCAPRFTARDRGFAQLVLAEGALSSVDLRSASKALTSGRTAFEECSEEDGLFLLEELEGAVALASGWRITAARRFSHFDGKLASIGDGLFSVYRWRRRAMHATTFGDEATVTVALASAKAIAIQHGLPSEDIETDLRELRAALQGREPTIGGRPWFVYWQTRLPRPLAIALGQVGAHPIGLLRWAEETCEFLETVLQGALNIAPEKPSRRSFGAKLQSLRAMARRWSQEHTVNKPQWDPVIAALEMLVEIRNRVVHGSTGSYGYGGQECLPLIQTLLHFTVAHISLWAVDSLGGTTALIGTKPVTGEYSTVAAGLGDERIPLRLPVFGLGQADPVE